MMTNINSETGATERILVVAGGSIHQFTAISTVDLLYLDSYEAGVADGWVSGPNLPDRVEESTMYADDEGVVIVGGYNGLDGFSLHKLTPTLGSWEKLPVTLNHSRTFHVSILVPDEIVTCHLRN